MSYHLMPYGDVFIPARMCGTGNIFHSLNYKKLQLISFFNWNTEIALYFEEKEQVWKPMNASQPTICVF